MCEGIFALRICVTVTSLYSRDRGVTERIEEEEKEKEKKMKEGRRSGGDDNKVVVVDLLY